MRSLHLLGFAVAIGLALAPTARAQHPPGAAPGESGCDLCHTSHRAGPGPYTLEVGDQPELAAGLAGRSEPLGTISRSCLRCHLTAGERTRQLQASGQALAVEGGRYLGLDLSNDHPLGRIDRSAWQDFDPTWRERRLEPPAPTSRTPGQAGSESLECTTCHDPHSRSSVVPEPDEENALCSECHEPARYLLQDHASLACRDCHRLHGGHDVALLAEPFEDVLCNSCHRAGGLQLSARVTRAGLPNAPEGHREPPTQSCASCHAVHQ